MLDYIQKPGGMSEAKMTLIAPCQANSFTSIEPYVVTALEIRYFESIFNSIIEGNGNVIGITVYLTDITDRMKTEEKLRVSEAYYKSLIREHFRYYLDY